MIVRWCSSRRARRAARVSGFFLPRNFFTSAIKASNPSSTGSCNFVLGSVISCSILPIEDVPNRRLLGSGEIN